MHEIEWKLTKEPVAYTEAVDFMEARVAKIHAQLAPEMVWFLQHPSIYTAGSSSKMSDLLDSKGCAVIQTGRGGKLTYHGPGQLVVYIMLNLKSQPDLKRFVAQIESACIATLLQFGIMAQIVPERVGIWVEEGNALAKIAAIGIRVRKWVTYHGLAINLNPNLDYFKGIIPCGISDAGVTSFEKLGKYVTDEQFIAVFQRSFMEVFYKNGD
jgi:lipoyl(octanoyl) transferase